MKLLIIVFLFSLIWFKGMSNDRLFEEEINSTEFNQSNEVKKNSLLQAAERIASNVISEDDSYSNTNPYITHNYTFDLILEALIELSEVTGRDEWSNYALSVIKQGGLTPNTPIPYQRQPFASINYSVYRATGDNAWLPVFVRESEFLRTESQRTPEGAVLYYSRARRGIQALLIDFIQEYCARMARCGQITWDDSFFDECVDQFKIYRSILRDSQTGLWSQGKGWFSEEPNRLSPGAWSRGHGWLLRGLTESLVNLPRESLEFKELQSILKELIEALLPLQDEDGMWHALLHLDPEMSPAESSGTAMIATAFSRIWREGLIEDSRILESALRAFAALPDYVDKNGLVLSTSPGPGPLSTENLPYLGKAFPAGNDHGTFAVLFAAVEQVRLEAKLKY